MRPQVRAGILGWEVALPVISVEEEEDEEAGDSITDLTRALLGRNAGETAAAYKKRCGGLGLVVVVSVVLGQLGRRLV